MDSLSMLFRDSQQAVGYMIREITHICRDLKKRAPGSEGEREAGEYLAGVLKNECGCEDVKVESFREHPAAFYGYFWFSAALDTLCAVSFFFSPWLSLVSGTAALLLFLFQFVRYRQVIDPLFPEKESLNVTAVRPCTGEVRQRIFLNGHLDAAWEFPLNYYAGGIIFEIPGIMAFIGVRFYLALGICRLCGAGAWLRTAGLWGLLFVPFFLLVAWTFNPGRVVDGANDNLTGSVLGITVLREMERLGVHLENTELGVILTGSEEAGLRGAKAWCRAHGEEYRDVPTCILCFDTIHDPEMLMVNAKDLNGTVASDPELCRQFLQAAEEVHVPCVKGKVPLMGGGTDSAAFTQGGFRSVGITGLSHKLEDYYHTRRDDCDNLNPAGLENCYRAVLRFLEGMDDPLHGG
ncbi:MAG: M20/M25/M40 family metallo-hydrolase [Oscillospiraceae bacterium]|nr:M20/M25/M40 family metallo-hydrolase [Oscillospiraceae bacterium]